VRSPLTPAGAAWRIAADVAIYRLRKREAGNLATSLTLGLALGLPWVDLGWRAAFGALLNLFVYLVNDVFDVSIDLAAPGRDTERTRFLAAHLPEAKALCVALAVALATAGALHSTGLLAAALINTAVILAYSGYLKHRPVADIASMGVWGVTMAMVGFPLESADGWRLAALLGLLSMVTEAVQVVRDEPSDRAAGVRTTAVVYGPRAASRVAKVTMLAAAAYAAVMIHPAGAVLAVGVLVALRPERASRSWDALRVLFGATWLALLWLRRA